MGKNTNAPYLIRNMFCYHFVIVLVKADFFKRSSGILLGTVFSLKWTTNENGENMNWSNLSTPLASKMYRLRNIHSTVHKPRLTSARCEIHQTCPCFTHF